jgi:hypothetical protein
MVEKTYMNIREKHEILGEESCFESIFSARNFDDEFLLSRFQINITNSVALVRERTIPTELPPLVGEVGCQLLQIEGCRMVSAADPLRP